jgi:D-alanine-D-alanine ligase
MVKLRVGVLMGGKSIEREVSFNSGRTVCDHLDTARYEVIPLFQTKQGHLYHLPPQFVHRGKTTDFEHKLATQARRILWQQLKNEIDFIYIALHGRYAEDGTLQGMLEVLQIPYLGTKVYGSALSMNKIMQKTVLRQAGIRVARDIIITAHQVQQYSEHPSTIDAIWKQLGQQNIPLPIVVKPCQEGSSLGISIITTQDNAALLAALHTACHADPQHPQDILLEECIRGMEFSCISIADYKTGTWRPLPPTEIVPETDIFDYEQKYMPGRATKFTPARCSADTIAKIHAACIQVSQTLEMKTISRIDGFVAPDGGIIIIDPNTISGMSPSSFLFLEAAEINMGHTQIINHLIETELHDYGMLENILLQESEHTMPTPKKRIAVLMGGRSNEKEISLESGRNITYKLSPQKYESLAIFVDSRMNLYRLNQSLLVRNSTKEIEQLLQPEDHIAWDQLPEIADFVFIGLHGGEGENGCVQGVLEMLGMPYNGSGVLTSALCMDKYKTAHFLRQHGFHTPLSLLLECSQWQNLGTQSYETFLETVHFPIIVKPHDDGCSVMVYKVNSITELQEALAFLFTLNKTHALLEEFISGMELTVGVIGNTIAQALPPSQAVAAHGILTIEEKFLPGAGENQTPAPLPSETLQLIQRTMQEAYTALNCKGYVRIDCFYQSSLQSPTGNERVIILEVNSLPGMTPATVIFHQAAELGIKPMDFIDIIIQYGFEQHTHTPSKITSIVECNK